MIDIVIAFLFGIVSGVIGLTAFACFVVSRKVDDEIERRQDD